MRAGQAVRAAVGIACPGWWRASVLRGAATVLAGTEQALQAVADIDDQPSPAGNSVTITERRICGTWCLDTWRRADQNGLLVVPTLSCLAVHWWMAGVALSVM